MDMSKEIEATCRKQHKYDGSVMPPQVCPYCMACPIGTIVVGIAGGGSNRIGPAEMPEDAVEEVEAWLSKVAVH